MRPSRQHDLQDLVAFSHATLTRATRAAWTKRLGRFFGHGHTGRRIVDMGGSHQPVAFAQLQRLQADVRTLIRQAVDVQALRVGHAHSPQAVQFDGPLEVAVLPLGRRPLLLVDGTPADRFRYHATQVLVAGGLERLRRCPSPPCETIFVRVGKRLYCSARCQARAYMRTYAPGAAGE